MIDLDDRILLNTGVSIINDDKVISMLLNDGVLPDYIRVHYSEDAEKYEEKFNTRIISEMKDEEITPDISFNQELFDTIITELYEKNRDGTDQVDHISRMESELSYFIDNNHQHLIIKLYNLINEFKKDGVVWGVGRGSSCSCYIFFLMEVNDINPIKYKIPFSEFSKEREYG